MKSIRISDEAYKKIVKRAKKDKRTITATIDMLVEEKTIPVYTPVSTPAAVDTKPDSVWYDSNTWEEELTDDELRERQCSSR
jgi:hypothetical protein